MDGPRLTFLVVLLLFIFFSPDQPSIRRFSHNERERLAVEKQQDFNALANSTYGDLPSKDLNLTGFRAEDGYQLHLLPRAQELSRRQRVDTWYGFDRQTPVYHDIDGQVKGDFITVEVKKNPEQKLNLTELDPSTDYLTRHFERNVTDAKGKVSFDLEDIDRASKSLKGADFLTREVKASVSIYTDSSPGNGWDARLRGVHFPSGEIILTTASRKFNALPALPHFGLSEGDFKRTTTVMIASLTRIWQKIEQGQVDDTPVLASPKCELVAWLHQKPLAGSRLYIDQIEKELRNPNGAPIGEPPPLAFSAVVFSPDCGYILQADTVFGPKIEAYSNLVRRLTAAFCLILVGQIMLLKRQMEKCATPSTRSRVSYHTFGIAAFGDGLILFAILAILIVDLSVYLLAGAAGFLCVIHVAFLEVKFIFDIWTVQVGDPTAAQRERQRRAGTANNTTRPAAEATAPAVDPPVEAPATTVSATTAANLEAGLPLPATARTPDNPSTIILPPDQDGTLPDITPRASFASLYSRFYFALINLVFFTLWATSWSPGRRHFYFNFLAFSFFSLWIPQIYRNIMRNCRKALTWEYVIGTSILRAVPILYWYIDDRNILSATTNPRTATFLLAWLWLQIMVLLSQQFLGPRIFIPEHWCPPAYDYHPILYDDLEAGGLPIGEVTSASEGKDSSADKDKAGLRKVFDCAICMNEIDVPVVSKDEKGKSGQGRSWLEQRNYMVTPCRHIFHSECLEGWMNLRLVCPVCREGLPPL